MNKSSTNYNKTGKCYKRGKSVMEKINEVNVLTKECIVTALLRLMEVKNYQDISITEITNLAGVSRMAYYRNYNNKDEILLNHLIDREKQLLNKLQGETADTMHNMIICIAEFFQENMLVIEAVFNAGLGHLLTNMLSERIYSYFPVVASDSAGKYAVQYYVGAIISVFRLWFDEGMKETVEEIADILCRLINYDDAMKFAVIP